MLKKLLFLFIPLLFTFSACKNFLGEAEQPAKITRPIKADSIYSIKDSSLTFIEISIPIYRSSCGLLITKDIEQAKDIINTYIGGNFVEKEDFDNSGLTVYTESSAPIIWLPSYNKTPEDISILNHELLHVTFYLLTCSNIPYDTSSEEAYTYLMQNLSLQFYKELQK